jgi:putative spermidine/putrescine transport system permease protein
MNIRTSADLWGAARASFNVLLCIFLLGPLVVVVIVSFSSARYLTFPPPGLSFQWYEKLFGDPNWAASFWASVKIMVPTGILSTIIGTAAAFGLHRSRSGLGRLVAGVVMAPLVVPGIVAAAGIYGVFRIWHLNGTVTGLVLAHTTLTVPFVVATVLPAIKMLDQRLVLAAYTLGASPAVAFRRIVLPLIGPAVVSGLLFAMIISFDELIVSLFLSTPHLQPVTVRMYSDVMGSVDPTISAIGTLIFVLSLAVLLIDNLLRTKLERRVREKKAS